MEVASRAGQTLAKAFTADLEKLGGDHVAHLEDLPEDVDQALAAIETEQHSGRAGDPGFVDQQADIGGDARRIWRIEIGCVVESVTIAAEGHGLRFQAAPLGVEHVVDDDAVEPRPEAAAPLERRQPSERLDEDLLRCVFGVLGMVEHADGDVVDPRLMALDQRFERIAVARLSARHEHVILGVSRCAVG